MTFTYHRLVPANLLEVTEVAAVDLLMEAELLDVHLIHDPVEDVLAGLGLLI